MSHGDNGFDYGAAFAPGHGGLDLGHGAGHFDGHGMHSHGEVNRSLIQLGSDLVSDILMLHYQYGADEGDQPGFDRVEGSGFERQLVGLGCPYRKVELTLDQMESIRLLDQDPERVYFGLHVVGHGKIDLRAQFAKVAEAHGCHRVDGFMPNFFGEDQETNGTHVWKQYWQVIRRPRFWDRFMISDGLPFPKPGWRFDVYVNTVLEVSGVTEYFQEIGDYETRFHIKVVPRANGRSQKQFKGYLKAARIINQGLLERMKHCPPKTISLENRRQLLDERLAIYHPEPANSQADRPVIVLKNPLASADRCQDQNDPDLVTVTVSLPSRRC